MKAYGSFTLANNLDKKPSHYVIELTANEVDNMMLHGDDGIINEMLVELNEAWGKYNEEG